MAETMVVEGDDTVGITGTVMRRAEDKGSQGTRKAHVVLPPAEVSEFIRNRPSDAEGLKQLLFHRGFALAAAWCVKRAREEGSLAGLVAAELALGFVASFYFTGLLRGKPSLESSRRRCERLVHYWSWFRSSGRCF